MLKKLYEILFSGEYDFYDKHLEISQYNDYTIKISYGMEYHSPELNFSHLKMISNLFGTDEINVDNFDYCGCESCDYGSDYGHDLYIKNPTKNFDEAKALSGKGYKGTKCLS